MIELLEKVQFERGSGKKSSLYQQITDYLRDLIETGQIPPGKCLPNISSMVKHWNVNYRTVNAALEQLSKEGLIQWEAQRGKKPLIIHDMQIQNPIMYIRWGWDSLSLEMTEGVDAFVEENELDCQIIDAGENNTYFIDAIETAIEQVSGILIMPIYSEKLLRFLKNAVDKGVKIVFLDRQIDEINASSVSVDHTAGAYKATSHLLRQHHKPVYYLGYDTKTSSSSHRYKGWASAMSEAGFMDTAPYHIEIPFVEGCGTEPRLMEETQNATLEILNKNKKEACCIFTMNDYIAMWACQAANAKNLIVGKDVFLGSFGNLPFALQHQVPLTSVSQKNRDVGYEGAKLLYMHMKGMLARPIHQKIPGVLHIRQSSVGNQTAD